MKLHSDILTGNDIYAATRAAGMRGVTAEVTRHGSRSRSHAFNVTLTGTSARRPGFGRGGDDDYAATWDEWGMFLSALYDIDPAMVCGSSAKSPTYADASHFHYATGGRFEALTYPYSAQSHKWEGVNSEAYCRDCDASQHWRERAHYVAAAIVDYTDSQRVTA